MLYILCVWINTCILLCIDACRGKCPYPCVRAKLSLLNLDLFIRITVHVRRRGTFISLFFFKICITIIRQCSNDVYNDAIPVMNIYIMQFYYEQL